MAYSEMIEVQDSPNIEHPSISTFSKVRVKDVVQKARTPLQRGLIFELMETPKVKESALTEADAELAELAETADLALKVLVIQNADEAQHVTLK